MNQQHDSLQFQRNTIQQRIQELQQRLKYRDNNTSNRFVIEPNKTTLNQKENKRNYSQNNMKKSQFQRKSQVNKKQINKNNENQFQECRIQPMQHKYIHQNEKNIAKQQFPQQLYKMMKEIIASQQNMEKDIKMLKFQYSKATTKRYQDQQLNSSNLHHSIYKNKEKSILAQKLVPINYSNQSIEQSRQQSKQQVEKIYQNQKIKQKKQQKTYISKQRKKRALSSTKAKYSRTIKKKKDNFEEVLHVVKMQKQNSEKPSINQQSKAKIWEAIQEKVKNSQKQHLNGFKINSKHQQNNLINTLELQKKQKEELLAKVYLLCNKHIYK